MKSFSNDLPNIQKEDVSRTREMSEHLVAEMGLLRKDLGDNQRKMIRMNAGHWVINFLMLAVNLCLTSAIVYHLIH